MPDKECIIPMIDTELCDGIRMCDLRDAICHSFVTAEETSNQIINDDRAKYEKRQLHEKLNDKTKCIKLPIEYVNWKPVVIMQRSSELILPEEAGITQQIPVRSNIFPIYYP